MRVPPTRRHDYWASGPGCQYPSLCDARARQGVCSSASQQPAGCVL